MAEQVRIFVSHSHKDNEFTSRLVTDLRAAGADVWVDTAEIAYDDFIKRIDEGLSGRQWLVLVMTPDALQSSYVRMEVNAALNRVMKGAMRGVIPIVAKDCQYGEIPPTWDVLHRYDATRNYEAALSSLLIAVGLQSPGAQSAQAPSSTPTSGGASYSFDDAGWSPHGHVGTDAGTPIGANRGADLKYELTISFDEAVHGCKKEIEIPRWVTCPGCGGAGMLPGISALPCPACGGTGEIRRIQRSLFGEFVNVRACGQCYGKGYVLASPCQRCQNTGHVRGLQRVLVNIPAGVDTGISVRVVGEGEVPLGGGKPGDLYVALTVAPHEFFKRRGTDIVYETHISTADAISGTEITAPTIDGPVRIKIPSGTLDGRVIRLKRKGVRIVHSSTRGDELVIIRVI